MEEHELYAKHYVDPNPVAPVEPGEHYLTIYKGIYQHKSSRGNIIYPVLKNLGCVNITTRQFFKGSKHPRKIIRQEGDRVVLFNYHNQDAEYTYTRMPVLFTELAYPEILLNEITNVVISVSNNPSIHSRDYNRVGGENDGIVDF